VGPRAGLDTEAKRKNPLPLSRIEPASPGRPARSQSLYCLSYSGSIDYSIVVYFHKLIDNNIKTHTLALLRIIYTNMRKAERTSGNISMLS
jgi:hypothetical protein